MGRSDRVHLVEFLDSDGGCVGVGISCARIEVRKIRGAALQFHDQLTHRGAPIAQVHVTGDVMTGKGEDSLQRLTDDRSTQMSDVELLGDIRAAVVDDDLSGLDSIQTQPRVTFDRLDVVGQSVVRQRDVDEAGPGDVDGGEHLDVREPGYDHRRKIPRSLAGRLGGSQGSIALELREFGTLRHRNRPVRSIDTRGSKCLADDRAEFCEQGHVPSWHRIGRRVVVGQSRASHQR